MGYLLTFTIYRYAKFVKLFCDMADFASMFPHSIKVYNLTLIRKMGWEKWALEKAKSVKDAYFTQKFDI